jgi:hypothetical protein
MTTEERRYSIDLSNKLIEKNNKIGILESQNSLLKLKLRLALREIDLQNHTVTLLHFYLFLCFNASRRFLLNMIVKKLRFIVIIQINIVKHQNNLH